MTGWRAYRAFLVVAGLMAGFLMALPIWDWWAYRHLGAESPSAGHVVPVATGEPRTDAVASPPVASPPVENSPDAGRVTLAAAMVVPRAQATARSQSAERTVRPAPPQSGHVAGPGIPAPAAADPAAVAARWRPPAIRERSAPIEGSGAAPAAQQPSIASPLVWARSRPVQAPLMAPPAEPQPDPEDFEPTDQESPDPTAETDPSLEKRAPRLSLLPAQPSVASGKIVSVRVFLSGGEGVTSVPFHLKFDPALLEFLGARTGSAFQSSSLEPLLLASVSPERPGDLAVGLALIGDSRSFSGSGSLVVLEFRAVGRGRAELNFENSSVRGATSEPLAAEFANTTVQVD